MIEEKNNNHREYFYKKYQSSNIFNTDLSSKSIEKIAPITPKPTEREYNKKFEPNYKTYTPYERYINQFYEKDESKIKKLLDERKRANLIKKNNEKLKRSRNKSASGRFFTEFFGNKVFNKTKERIKNEKIKRNDSFYEKRLVYASKENNKKLNINTSKSFSQLKKYQNNLSNIFFDKTKKINLNNLENNIISNISTESSEKKNLTMKNKKIKRSILPSKFDWKTVNTEIASKSYIENSKKKSDKKIYNTKPKEFEKIISDYSKTPYKEKRENSKKIQPDKDHLKYEIIGNKDLFLKLDSINIKKMFSEQGIHIYNFDGSVTHNDFTTKGKITFNLRRDKEEKGFEKKFETICKKINSYGVKLNEIKSNNNLYKKIRQATPGKELKNRKKEK